MRAASLALVGVLTCALPALARAPVLVELYTSQGCGTCAEAGQLINRLADRPDLLPLTFSVDTWDYLGWTDTFARPEFGDRQRSFSGHWPRQAIFTPQVVVAGRGQARADETETVEKLIRRAEASDHDGPKVRLGHGRATIGDAPGAAAGADVWLIRYDPRSQDVEVRKGENAGRTLTYRNVVRELVKLGRWDGRKRSFVLPAAKQDGLTSVVVLQKPDGGEVLALASS